MARVTVEDCVQKVPNRFELVLLAAQRARNLSRGEELTIDRDNDKNPVVALREIADETIDLGRIEQDLIKSLSRAPEPEPADEEVLDLIPTDQNIFGLQDVTAEEEAATLPVEGEEMSPEDLEAAIEAELGGRNRPVIAHDNRGVQAARSRGRPSPPPSRPTARRPMRAPRTGQLPPARPDAASDRKAARLRPEGGYRADRRRLHAGDAGARHAAPRQRRSLYHPSGRGGRHPGRLPAGHRLDRHRPAARRDRGHAGQAAGDPDPVRQARSPAWSTASPS